MITAPKIPESWTSAHCLPPLLHPQGCVCLFIFPGSVMAVAVRHKQTQSELSMIIKIATDYFSVDQLIISPLQLYNSGQACSQFCRLAKQFDENILILLTSTLNTILIRRK